MKALLRAFADPETERQHNNGAEAWIPSQRPDCMAKIVEERRHAALTERTAKQLVEIAQS